MDVNSGMTTWNDSTDRRGDGRFGYSDGGDGGGGGGT